MSASTTVPNKIAFISDIGGSESLYVVDPDQSDIKLFSKLHIEGERISSNLRFSPDGKRLTLLAWSVGGKGPSVWIINTDGSDARRLVAWKRNQQISSPGSWSPTGDSVALVITEENVSRIYAMKPDGSDFHFVALGHQFSWSPDGRQLVLPTYVREKRESHIQIVNVDGTEPHSIYTTGGIVADCIWSPDGKRVAYRELHTKPGPEDTYDIFVITPDGRQKETVIENVPLYSHLSWSPEGKNLSFVTRLENNQGLFLWSARADRAKRFRFFPEVQVPFWWLADGRRVVYGPKTLNIFDFKTQKTKVLFHTSGFHGLTFLPDGDSLVLYNIKEAQNSPYRQDLNLYIARTEPLYIKRLTDDTMNVVDTASPANGAIIAFLSSAKANDGSFTSAVYSIRSDGSNLRKLGAEKIEPGWFAWSADGSKIAYVKEMTECRECDRGKLQINVANADGSDEQTIVNEPAWNFAPAWLPDGKSILFLSDRGNTHAVYTVGIKSRHTQLVADVSVPLPHHLTRRLPPRSIGSLSGVFVPIIWSPDATKFATSIRTGPSNEALIRIVDVKKPSTPFEFGGFGPSVVGWSPDSRRIAVIAGVHNKSMSSITPTYVDIVAIDGSSRVKLISDTRQLSPNPEFVGYRSHIFRMAWSLDGKRVVCNGITTFAADGSNWRWLTWGLRPVWVR